MADLSITAANVLPVDGVGKNTATGTSAGIITAGEPIYLASANSNKVTKCEADDTAAAAACVGIAINDAAASQSVTYLKSGNLDINAVATKGTVYVVSAAAGKIAPVADLVSTNFVTILGVASSTTRINIKLNATGVSV